MKNKVTTNSKLTNEESPTQTTSYKKFMDVFNLIKNKGEVNELGNGYILKNVETKILDGGMSRLIQWENFEAHMDYFNEITYKNGDENTLSNILINLEKITEMCKHNWETFDYDGERSIVYCTKCDKVKVKYHTLLRK
jgi:hypothetical protein